jgi:hypothetical protein
MNNTDTPIELMMTVEDRDFILNGVKDGFKLSVIYGPHLPVDRDNYTSAFRFRSAVGCI